MKQVGISWSRMFTSIAKIARRKTRERAKFLHSQSPSLTRAMEMGRRIRR